MAEFLLPGAGGPLPTGILPPPGAPPPKPARRGRSRPATSRSVSTDFLDGVEVETGALATMRDGVRLSADIYRPVGAGPWPVLLMRQPYGREIASTVVYAQPAWFARQGYMVVIQDVRGRGGSEGEFYPFRDDEADGFDTVAWSAGLRGSNGRVGMYGFSYQSTTQLLAAVGRPPALRAIAPHMTVFDKYPGWFYRGGLLQLHTTLYWGNQMLRDDALRSGEAGLYARLEKSWLDTSPIGRQQPLTAVDPLTDPRAAPYVRDWLEHDDYDAYWQRHNLLDRAGEIAVPVFHISGWYDWFLRGTMAGYRAASSAGRSEQFIVCSPWIHLPWTRNVGAADLGPDARLDVDALLVAWFDHWLKDRPRDPRTRGALAFVLGENRWIQLPSWPPPGSADRSWFLASGGRANSVFGDGRLDAGGARGPCDQFVYDPQVPVLAPGGQVNGSLAWGSADLGPSQQGNNLLVYSARLDRPLRVAGAPRCRLFVRSSAPDTAFVARLSRVTPGGAAVFLTLGAARLRDGSKGPDGSTELVVQLDDTCCQFEAGDGLRLDVASSAFPMLALHPNTLASPNRVASPSEFRRARQVVYHDERRPSALELPVSP
jgi:putative CocE/NonD family hydrolase